MAYALQCLDKRHFWDEMRRLTNNRCNMPNIVNSAQGDNEMCTTFRNKYNDLYNIVSYNSQAMKILNRPVSLEHVNLHIIVPRTMSAVPFIG